MTKQLQILTKRWRFIVSLVLASMMMQGGYAQTCGPISNSGFENNLVGWTSSGTVTIVADVHSGTKAARVGTNQGGVNGGSLIPVTAGQQITFQVWAKISASPSWAGVGIDFVNSSGTEISEVVLQVTSTTYTLRSATQTVPAGATHVRIWTWKSGSAGNLFVDDFCISTPDTQAPSTPTGLASSAITQTSFTLNWTSSTDNVGVTGYEVFRNGVSIGTPTATSLNVTGLSAGTVYAMRVRARDASGNWSAQSMALNVTTTASDTQPPSTPAGLASSGITQTNFTLNWAASTDNVGVTGYEVFRNGTSIGTPTAPSINVTGLSAGTAYAMTVRARDAAGNWSAQSSALNVTTTAADTQAPSIPTGLSSSSVTQTGFTLNWTAATDNFGVTGYEVFRNGTSIGTPTATSLNVTGLSAGTAYAMTVRARDAAGNWSAQSVALNVTTSAATPTSCGSITNNGFENGLTGWANNGNTAISADEHLGVNAALTGTGAGGLHYGSLIPAVGGQSISFKVWGKISGAPSFAGVGVDYLDASGTELNEAVIDINTTVYTEYIINGTAPAGTANIHVWTWKSGTTGNLFLDDFCLTVSGSGSIDTQAPSVPSGLASANITSSGFTFSWTASSDNIGVTGYEVFRNGTSAGTTTSTSLALTDLAASTTYAMTVRARDAAGNWSAQSGALNVTTTSGGNPGGPFTVTIDKSIQHQTIDGFGFFGAQDVWWSNPSSLWSDAWGDQVISDLGITIWRTEHFPPSDQLHTQDADWNKQLPVVRGLKSKADQFGVDLKFIFTVWSPPASMKVRVDNNTRMIGTPHPFGTKQGGALDPTKYTAFANFLKTGIQRFEDEGIDVYAISPQNEPFFVHSFNSCWYKQEWYPEMLIGVIPAVKATYPDVKIFGSEGMLEMEAADNNWRWFYHKQILDNQQARNNIDILAIHGYSDGVAPTSGSALGHLWDNHKTIFANPMGKSQWMTETSGYDDSWSASPGAFSLALDMMSGLNNGNMSGWVWWQGSENPGSSGIGEFALMNGLVRGKKYYASKQFYRYIRPGAVRVTASSTNNSVSVSAYQHTAQGTHTIVLANTSSSAQSITVGGANLPTSFTIFRTSATDNCANAGTYTTGTSLSLPARSLVTLQAGGTPLATTTARVANSARSGSEISDEVNSETENSGLLVYPNPIHDEGLTVDFSALKRGESVNIDLNDISGKQVRHYSISADRLEIKQEELPAKGIYILKVNTGFVIRRVKVLIE